MDRRLPGRVSSTDDIDGLPFARDRLRHSPAVVDAGVLETVHTWHFEPTPLHPGRDHQSMTGDLAAIAKLEITIWPFDSNADRLLRSEDLNSKALRLVHGASRQIGAAQS